MVIKDLGELHGEVLLYGGPYSNLAAMQELVAVAKARGIPPENRICTGDVVAYAAEAEATWALVAQAGGAVVAGNCEKQLAARAEGCGCGFEEGTACDLLSKAWYDHAQKTLSEEALAWMADVPDLILFQHGGLRYAVIHGGVTDIARFLWPSSPDDEFQQEIDGVTALIGHVDRIAAGHCGIAFQRQIGSLLWINAGVIGLPPHDGRSATRYATLDAQGRVMLERLSYDTAPTVAAMEAAGLVQGYHASLQSGIWPSEDVLPLELRRTG
ncbi:MAG: metallophosphoesterase family protein [Dinoroseobacter sp.]|nr:metallophosphoesterase family protein [Dinoroseobacter sp.]